MILELILTAALLQTIPPNAGPNDSIAWDHDGVATDHYEARWDGGSWNSTNMDHFIKIPALTIGLHTVDARACNGMNCSDPLTLQFNMIAVPVPVSNIRVNGTPVLVQP